MDPITATGVIFALAVSVFLGLCFRAARRDTGFDPATGTLVLQHFWMVKTMAWLSAVVMPLIVVSMVIAEGFKEPEDPLLAAACLLMFAAMGGVLVLTTRVQVVFADDRVIARSFWQRKRSFLWTDVAEVSFSSINKWFIIVGPEGETVRVWVFLVGVRSMEGFLRRHLPTEKLTKAQRGFELVGSRI